MRRRQFVGLGAGALSLTGLAGCLGGTDPEDTRTTTPTPTTTEPGRGVYIQSFEESMSMQGAATSGDYRFALMFAVPHDFWTVTLDERQLVAKTDEDSIHLMSVVWDPETNTVLPDVGLSVEILRDGDLVSQEQIYAMLSQPMGFHYGGNFELPEDGRYTVRLSVSGVTARTTSAFQGRFSEGATAEIDLAFTPESREEVRSRPIDQAGDPGALAPMEMGMLPRSVLPPGDEMPGELLGESTSDDARFVALALDSPPGGLDADGDDYLAVSPRTPYNRLVLPGMALSGTLVRDGETVFEGRLPRTLDPDLGYHHGAAVGAVESGDVLRLTVDTPPQVARHEGYEEAFLSMPPMELTVP